MNKTALIIKREFLTRVRKKSFIIMSLVGPLLFAGFIIAYVWLIQAEDTDKKRIAVADHSGKFEGVIPETPFIKFNYVDNVGIDDIRETLSDTEYYALLFIPADVYQTGKIMLYSEKQPTIDVKSYISNAVENELSKNNMKKTIENEFQQKDVESESIERIIASRTAEVDIDIIKWTDEGEETHSSPELFMVVGYIAGFLIYMFVLMYGAQVMRGVIEEKTSRVVEIIVSSVRPFQLMMGKIVGIAMVGLTQFLIWILLTLGIVMAAQNIFLSDKLERTNPAMTENVMQNDMSKQMAELENSGDDEIQKLLLTIQNFPIALTIVSFVFYFIGGYLLYASLFAAIGSAVDNETDTQQFMFPITIPLILALIVMVNVIQHPTGAIAQWFSIIPFTSPIVMMVRIPFGVPDGVSYLELIASVVLLVATFIATTWLAAKIYRTGILLYGKKVNYKELWKWLRYRN